MVAGEYPDIARIFSDFAKLKVLIIGDVMVDAYVWGKVERISPEAPVPVLIVSRIEKRLGRAANDAKGVVSIDKGQLMREAIKYREPS